MSKVKDIEYLFITSDIRAKEAKMLTKEKTERMLSEPTFSDAARLLVEFGYEDMSAMDSRGINATLDARLAAEIAEISELVPQKCVTELFCLKYDYHNAKVIIKSEGLNEAGEKLILKIARTDIEELVRIYETEESMDASPRFVQAVNAAKETLARTGNPQLADFILDKAYFAEMQALAAESGDEFIIDYARMIVDSANLRMTVRSLLMGRRDLLEKAVVEGGKIDTITFLNTVSTQEDVAALFTNMIFETATQMPNITSFEREVDNAINGFLSRAAMMGFGAAAVLAYLNYVEAEIMTIRIILTGKLGDISADALRERLRESYV